MFLKSTEYQGLVCRNNLFGRLWNLLGWRAGWWGSCGRCSIIWCSFEILLKFSKILFFFIYLFIYLFCLGGGGGGPDAPLVSSIYTYLRIYSCYPCLFLQMVRRIFTIWVTLFIGLYFFENIGKFFVIFSPLILRE